MRRVAKVSIIMPVFNTRHDYLEAAINSVLHQSYENIELLIVNDGSDENTSRLCKALSLTDARVRLIEQHNQGVSAARNNGLRRATGDYVVFVDADDIVSERYVQEMLCIALEQSVDIVIARYSSRTRFVSESAFRDGSLISKITTEQALCGLLTNKIPTGPMSKLFNAEIVRKVEFDERLSIGEDLEFNFRAFQRTNSIASYDGFLYWYRISGSSAMRAPFSARRHTGLLAAVTVLEAARRMASSRVRNMAEYRLFMEAVFILADMPDNDHYLDLRDDCISIMKKYRVSVINNKGSQFFNKFIAIVSLVGIKLSIELFRLKKRTVGVIKRLSEKGRV